MNLKKDKMNFERVFLIGYRGTGKTTIGKIVAKKIGKKFIDTDKLIVEIAGKTIPEIFSQDGEKKFREIETLALKKAVKQNNIIISCGGGIITIEENFELLKKGFVFLLNADSKTIYNRIYNDSNRPPLTDKNPFEEIEHLLKIREPLYKKAADFEIDTTNNSLNDCVEIIIQKIDN